MTGTTSAADSLPALPALPRAHWRAALHGSIGHQRHFIPVEIDGWRGLMLRRLPLPRPWSQMHEIDASEDDWRAAWPALLRGIHGAWTLIKTDRGGDILAGQATLGGRVLQLIVKRPRRTRAAQWAVDLLRPARARRTWLKTWKLLFRGLPTEIPLLVMERRRGLVVVDNLVVFERVPGSMLARLELDELDEPVRRSLLRQAGATIRATERLGFTHTDAKTTNWIAFPESGMLRPVMLDCDGVRPYARPGRGLRRFLKALAQHAQARTRDLRDACDGYAPEGWPPRVQAICARQERSLAPAAIDPSGGRTA